VGFPVFCQKPLGRNADEARAAVDAARRADRLLGVDFSYRYTQAAQAIRSLIAAGELGEIFACDMTFHNAYGPDKPWFHDVAQSGGGCVMDLGVHLIDLALWMLPLARIERTEASIFKRGERLARPPESVEDFAHAHMRLSTGADLRVACSWNLHAGQDAVISAEFHGSRGGARMRNINGSFYDFAAEKFAGTQTHLLCDAPDAWGGRAAIHWMRMLASSPGFDPQAEDFVRVSAGVDAVYGRRAAY
jgi:predicted dehydrogenase